MTTRCWIAWIVLPMAFITSTIRAELTWETQRIEKFAAMGDETSKTSFRFTNTGTTDVTILSTATTCGCTTATLDKNTYRPGERGEIKTTFTLGNRVGNQEKTISVLTTDNPALATILTFSVRIPEIYQVEPRLVIWEVNEPPSAKTIRLSAASSQRVFVKSAKSDNSEFSLTVESENEGLNYVVHIAPKSSASSARALIQLELEAGGKYLSVTAYAVIR